MSTWSYLFIRGWGKITLFEIYFQRTMDAETLGIVSVEIKLTHGQPWKLELWILSRKVERGLKIRTTLICGTGWRRLLLLQFLTFIQTYSALPCVGDAWSSAELTTWQLWARIPAIVCSILTVEVVLHFPCWRFRKKATSSTPTIPRSVHRIRTLSRNWFPLANRQPADQTVCSPPLQDQQQQEELVRIMGEFCVQEQQPRHDCSKGDDLLAMMDNLWPPARQQLRQCRLLPATFLQHNIERLSKLWTFVIYSSTTFCTKSWTPVLYGFVHLWTGSLLNESNCNCNRHCFSPSEPGMRMLRQMVGSVNEVASRREMNFWSDNCVYFFPESTSVKFKLLLVITGP